MHFKYLAFLKLSSVIYALTISLLLPVYPQVSVDSSKSDSKEYLEFIDPYTSREEVFVSGEDMDDLYYDRKWTQLFSMPSTRYDSLSYFGYWKEGTWKPYDKVINYPAGRVVEIDHKRGFIGENHQVMIPVVCDYLDPILEPSNSFLAPLYQPGKQFFKTKMGLKIGIVDEQGKVMISFQYANIWDNGMALDTKGWNKWRYFELDMKTATRQSKELPFVPHQPKGQRGWGLQDRSGKQVLPYAFRDIAPYGEYGLYAIRDTLERVFLLTLQLDTVWGPNSGFKRTKGQRYWTNREEGGLFDAQTQRWIFPPHQNYRVNLEYYYLNRFIVSHKPPGGIRTIALTNEKGEFLVPFGTYKTYDSHYYEEIDVFLLENDEGTALFDTEGKRLLPFGKYDEIEWKNDMIVVRKGDQYGFFHPQDRVFIEPQFDGPVRNVPYTPNFEVHVRGEKRLLKYENGVFKLE